MTNDVVTDLREALSENSDEPGDGPRIEVMTAKALCELPDPPTSDLLVGPLLIRGQRTVIGGYTGEGKTSLTLRLVQTATEGGEFLDWSGAGGNRAIVIDAEQGVRSIKRGLRETGLDRSEAVDYLRAPHGLSLDQSPDAKAVEAQLAAGGYALVVADPLYKLHRGDSNEERHATDLMRLFDRWREQYGFALVFTMHPRKRPAQGTRFTMDELFGSGAYLRGAEVVLGLERPRAGRARLHFFKDRDGDLPVGEKWGLLFDREQGYERDPEDGKYKPNAAEQVRELLAADPGLTQDELVEATKKAKRTVRGALGEIEAVGTGHPKRWRLPSGTQEELE